MVQKRMSRESKFYTNNLHGRYGYNLVWEEYLTLWDLHISGPVHVSKLSQPGPLKFCLHQHKGVFLQPGSRPVVGIYSEIAKWRQGALVFTARRSSHGC